MGLAVKSVQLFYWRHGALRKLAPRVVVFWLISVVSVGFGLGLGLGVLSGHALPDARSQQDLAQDLAQDPDKSAATVQVDAEHAKPSSGEEEARRLRALAINLGVAEARLARLEALGKRLVDLGGLDKNEFDLDGAPALGGPEDSLPDEASKDQSCDAGSQQDEVSSYDAGSTHCTNSLDAMEEAVTALQRRAEQRDAQLSALEGWLSMRSLHQAMRPAGSPLGGTWIASPFGVRRDPFTGRRAFHAGYDLEAQTGEPVSAVAEGIVVKAERSGAYGLLVEINHGGGYHTRYGHNSKLLVNAGDKVLRGQVVALAGSTGRSTGTHVHFEVLFNDKPVNPASFLRSKG